MNSIENGLQITKAKEQVKRVFHSIRVGASYENTLKGKPRKRDTSLTIDVDEEPDMPQTNTGSTTRNDETSDLKVDNIFSIAIDKENSHPNIIETSGGRLSLQPQPLVGFNSLNQGASDIQISIV